MPKPIHPDVLQPSYEVWRLNAEGAWRRVRETHTPQTALHEAAKLKNDAARVVILIAKRTLLGDSLDPTWTASNFMRHPNQKPEEPDIKKPTAS